MKTIFLTICLMCIATVAGAQYHCTVQSSTDNTVTFRSTGYGKNTRTATADAELNAVRTLIFAGATGTNYQTPLVSESRQAAESKYKETFSELYESAYHDFIESAVTVTVFGKDAEKRKCTTLDICVRARQLRSWLESNGVIRRFGL